MLSDAYLNKLTNIRKTLHAHPEVSEHEYETKKRILKFLAEENVRNLPMPESGRSTKSIINLANHLINWTRSEHPSVDGPEHSAASEANRRRLSHKACLLQ